MGDPICPVCDECFSTAIDVETAAKLFYLHLMELFSSVPEAAEIFQGMMRDETMHARTLKEAKKSGLHSSEVHNNAPAFTRSLHRVIREYGEAMKAVPQNLDKAFDLAFAIERTEINNIYINLIVGTRNDADSGEQFVVKLIREHLQRLYGLGQLIDKDRRQAILPKSP